jgi:hypothetical protein
MKTTFNPHDSETTPTVLPYDSYWVFDGPICSAEITERINPASERDCKNMSGTDLKSREFILRNPGRVKFIRRYSDGSHINVEFKREELISIIDSGALYDKCIKMRDGANYTSFYLSTGAVKYLYEWREFVKWDYEIGKYLVDEFTRYAGDDFIIRDKIVYKPDFRTGENLETLFLPYGYMVYVKNTEKGSVFIIPNKEIYRSIQSHYWYTLGRIMGNTIGTDNDVIALGLEMTGIRNRPDGHLMTDRDIVENVLGEFLRHHYTEFRSIMDGVKTEICNVHGKHTLKDFYDLNPGYQIKGVCEYLILNAVYFQEFKRKRDDSNKNHSNVIELPFKISKG